MMMDHCPVALLKVIRSPIAYITNPMTGFNIVPSSTYSLIPARLPVAVWTVEDQVNGNFTRRLAEQSSSRVTWILDEYDLIAFCAWRIANMSRAGRLYNGFPICIFEAECGDAEFGRQNTKHRRPTRQGNFGDIEKWTWTWWTDFPTANLQPNHNLRCWFVQIHSVYSAGNIANHSPQFNHIDQYKCHCIKYS